MELGIMSNVFRWKRLDNSNSPYIDQVRACADAGFRVIDLNMNYSIHPEVCGDVPDDLAADDWEARIDALGNEAAKLGVVFSQGHAPFNPNIFIRGSQPSDDFMALFRDMSRRSVIAAGRLGIKWLTVHPQTDTVNTEYDNEIQKKTNIDFYSPMIGLAKKLGVGISFENMLELNRERSVRSYCASTDELIDLVDTLNDPAVGVTWDFGHAHTLVSDQPRQLRKLGARLKATHVQDNHGARDSHLIPFVGGNIKWENIMPALREINYTGDFVFETHMFMKQIPDALRPAAGRLMKEFGQYCLDLYKG